MIRIMLAAGLLAAGSLGIALETRQLAVAKAADVVGGDGKTYTIERIGKPLPVQPASVHFVTAEPAGAEIAWGVVRSPEVYGVIGYDVLKNERHWIDLSKYHGEHGLSPAIAAGNGALYILAGNRKPCIFKYDIGARKLTVLKTIDAKKTGRYWLGNAVGPDGSIYYGIHPSASLLAVDPATDKITDFGRLPSDPEQMYIILPAVDDDRIAYAPVGLGKQELYAVDTRTGAKKQILSPEQQAKYDAVPGQKKVEIVLKDGRVYWLFDQQYYRCGFDGVATEPTPGLSGKDDPRRIKMRTFANGEKPLFFDDAGLHVEAAGGGSRRVIAVEYPDGVGHELYAVGDVRDNVLYGSGIFGAKVFGLDLGTLRSTDFGIIATGTIQNYDLMNTPDGILLSSYTEGGIDLFVPEKPLQKGVNPRPLARLSRSHGQERMRRFVRACGAIYAGAVPIKARLGGALVKIDPAADYRVTVWKDILPDQSIGIVCEVPGEPALLFLPGSVQGGSSSIPKLTEADVAIWDTAAEKIIWTGRHPKKFADYNNAMPTSDGKILLFANDGEKQHYMLFDPATRTFAGGGELQGRRGYYGHPVPVGPDRSNYFVVGDTLHRYNPRTGMTRLISHPSFAATNRFQIQPDGMMYYLDNSRLMRVKLF